VVSFTAQPLYPQGKSLVTHWIGGWVGLSYHGFLTLLPRSIKIGELIKIFLGLHIPEGIQNL
jgi:hypothetical protein